ncbi:MAG: DUF1553 domain-containing protein [Fimbriimonadaceae bacterium]
MRLSANASTAPACLSATLVFGIAVAVSPSAKPANLDFIHDVAPIFKAHCLRCHGGPNPSGGLDLSSVTAMRNAGAIAPGKSAVVQRLLGKGGAQMPMGAAPLTSRDIQLVAAWIDAGAPELGKGRAAAHWAYVAPVAAPIPRLMNAAWVRNPIDAFVLRRLRAEGMNPAPEADRPTLIRRLSLDLIGLPPTPAEVDAFVADRSPQAYEKVVDRLLASPHFGERMALPWLDAARYADSNGFQMDGDNYQYVWRDWVVKALNQNMPFDIFTIDQLAGDLLPHPTQDQLVATAFNRNNMLNGEGGAIPEEQRCISLFDRVDTTATTWLGITMACARCHDHKYDPFTQRDYYSLMAYFNNVPETGIVGTTGHYDIADPWIYAGTPAQMRSLKRLQALVASADLAFAPVDGDKSAQARWLATAKPKDAPKDPKKLHDYYLDHGLSPAAKAVRDADLAARKNLHELQGFIPRVMIMSDAHPRVTHIFYRGNYTSPTDVVHGATPVALTPKTVGASGLPPSHRASAAGGNRLDFARWVVSRDNPLTARVQVNRYWQQFFGLGLVKTPENFGVQSEQPAYQDLLDWLAVKFERGWDVKSLIRTIVTSATYRQSSKITPILARRDPENRLLARGARFRLPSMLLRDVALAASGLLNPAVGGKPVYPYQPPGIWDSLDITDERSFKYPQSHGADLYRRSLYTFWRRTIAPGNMFDAATRQTCTVKLGVTSTPLHALTTMNDVTWVEAARALAQKVIHASSGTDARLSDAFRRVCARRPRTGELAILRRSLNRAEAYFHANPTAAQAFLNEGESRRDTNIDPVWHAAYASVCLAIFNLDEALSRE